MTTVSDTSVERSRLGSLVKLGGGGQGDVYRAANVRISFAPSTAYKEYKTSWRPSIDFGALQAMVAFLAARNSADGSDFVSRVSWPVRLVADSGRPVGFLMPEVPAAFWITLRLPSGKRANSLAQLQYLLNPAGILARRGIVLPDNARYLLLADLAAGLDLFHRFDIAVGDLSPKNVLFALSPRPRCFFVDSDAMRVSGKSAVPQAETPDWEIARVSQEELATTASDRYKLGLFVLRLLAGDQSTRNVSDLPPGVSPAIRELTARALSHDPAARPAAADWIGPLRDAASRAPAIMSPTSTASAGAVIVPKARRAQLPPPVRRANPPWQGWGGAHPPVPPAGAKRPARGGANPGATHYMNRTGLGQRASSVLQGTFQPPPAPAYAAVPPFHVPVGRLRWAGVGVRAAALAIDAAILVAFFIAVIGFEVLLNHGTVLTEQSRFAVILSYMALIWIAVMYHPTFWYQYGATPGQKIMRLHVVRLADGQLLSGAEVIVRFLVFAAVTLVTPFAIMSMKSAAIAPYGQAWHDQAVGSVVVERY